MAERTYPELLETWHDKDIANQICTLMLTSYRYAKKLEEENAPENKKKLWKKHIHQISEYSLEDGIITTLRTIHHNSEEQIQEIINYCNENPEKFYDENLVNSFEGKYKILEMSKANE